MALYRTPNQNNLQYTLDSQIGAADSSLTLNQSVATVVRAPGVIVIDRVDSSGNATASKREFITFTGVSGAQLTGLTRGQAGSTAQVHAVAAIVEFLPDVIWADAIYTTITAEHDTVGTHISLASVSFERVITYLNASGASLSGGFLNRARAYKNAAQNVSTPTKIQLDAESYDTSNGFDSTTNYRFTAPSAGFYQVVAAVGLVSMPSGQGVAAYIYKNGAEHAYTDAFNGSGAVAPIKATISDILQLSTNDYIELYGADYGANTRALELGASKTFMAVHQLSTN